MTDLPIKLSAPCKHQPTYNSCEIAEVLEEQHQKELRMMKENFTAEKDSLEERTKQRVHDLEMKISQYPKCDQTVHQDLVRILEEG